MLCESVFEGQKFTTGQTEDQQPTHPGFTGFSFTTSVLTVCMSYIVLCSNVVNRLYYTFIPS